MHLPATLPEGAFSFYGTGYMKIAVIGPGALGCLFAACLARQGDHEVWLLDRDSKRAAFLHEKGLLFDEGERRERIPVNATSNPADIGTADLFLLCVKSYAVQGCLPVLKKLAQPENLVLALQNGIGHLELMQREGRFLCWAVGITSQGATLIAPGHVRHGGHGLTRLGFIRAASDHGNERLHAAASAFAGAGIETVLSNEILVDVWAKLLVNVGINALTAIYDCPNGRLLEIPEALDKQKAAVLEAAAVARGLGISVPGDPVAMTREVCRATAGNISSMLQDVRNRRQTEIADINGAIAEKAAELGIDALENERLCRDVRVLERGYLP